jgi:predicted enzyme related to lactoylglutathione lyase/quinol monooxygenase YgiN
MSGGATGFLSLTSKWFIRPGAEAIARQALEVLASQVQAGEPDTLAYLVHLPAEDQRVQSLPPADPDSVLFFEVYRDVGAFLRHVNGPLFTGFVASHGDLFVASNGKPFVFVEFLARAAGFIRPEAAGLPTASSDPPPANDHPAVMFEVIARDQERLMSFYRAAFGWRYDIGTGNFAYVRFPPMTLSLLGGIGQADPGQPGFEPGHNFYLQVDDVAAALQRALAAGASMLMPRTELDGYTFAMVRDPEGNPLGLIERISA